MLLSVSLPIVSAAEGLTTTEEAVTPPVQTTVPDATTEPPVTDLPITGTLGSSLTYTLDPDDGVLRIVGSGSIPDYTASSAPFLAYADQIRSLLLDERITSIGANAFLGLSVTEVTVPDGVLHIGSYAFGYYLSGGSYETVSGFTLRSGNGTKAETYAAENGFTFRSTAPDPTGTCGNGITWHLSTDGVLTLTGSGRMNDYTSQKAPYAAYATGKDGYRVTSLIVGDGITYLGEKAFEDFTQLAEVSLPQSLTKIGASAFDGCSSLRAIVVPASVTVIDRYAFSGCYELSSLSLSAGLTTIGERAFEMTALTSLSLPSTVTSLGKYAFYGCSSLRDASLGSVTLLPEKVFATCDSLQTVTFSAALTEIGASAFEECSSLLSLSFPSGLTAIGERAFYGCSSLSSVVLPDSLTALESYAFYGCSSLTSLNTGNGVPSLPAFAFGACPSLSSVTIGSSVASLGEYAFVDCTALASIYLPYTVKSIQLGALGYVKSGSTYIDDPASTIEIIGQSPSAAENYAVAHAFPFTSRGTVNSDGGAVNEDIRWTFTTATGVLRLSGTGAMPDYATVEETPWGLYASIIKAVVVDNGITFIGASSFDGCSALTGVSLPSTLRTVGSGAFAGTALTTLSLPDGLETIEDRAFENCTELASVSLPDSLVHIGPYAFCGDEKLTSLLLPASVEYIGTYAVGYNASFEIIEEFYISGSKDSAAKQYADHEGIPFRENGHQQLTDPSSGASVSFPSDSDSGFSFAVTKIEEGLGSQFLLQRSEFALVYDVSVLQNNLPFSLQGTATLTLPVPEGINPLSVSLYSLSGSGSETTILKCEAEVSGGYFVIRTNTLSRLVISNADLLSLSRVTVHCLYTDGTPASDPTEYFASTGAVYTFTAPELEGFTPDHTELIFDTASGDNDLHLTFTYSEATTTTAPPASTSATGKSGKTNWGAILLPIILILVLALVAAVVLLLYLNKKKKKQRSETAKTIAAADKNGKSDQFAPTIIVPEFKTQEINIESLFADEPEEDVEAEEALKTASESESQPKN